MGQAIDPSIFTDDDGTSYILYGNGSAAIAQLSDDMMSVVPGTVKRINGLNNFRESVVVSKRDGGYHWTCHATMPDRRITTSNTALRRRCSRKMAP